MSPNPPSPTALKASSPVKPDPTLAQLRLGRIIGICLAVIYFVLIVSAIVIRDTTDSSVFYVNNSTDAFLLFPLLFIGGSLIVNSFLEKPAYKALEQKRQAAALGDQQFLASEQPRPLSQEPVLPLTIDYTPNWPLYLLVAFFISILPTAFLLLIDIWLHFALSIFIYITLYIAAFFAMLIWAGMKADTQLIVDDAGITLKNRLIKEVHAIPWREARLFAITPIPVRGQTKDAKKQLRTQLELASADDIIRLSDNWKDMQTKIPLIRTNCSEREYAEKMQELKSLIAAKTGLPLYDLRK